MLPIRSYMRRQGRMLPAQRLALAESWQDYGVIGTGRLDLDTLFGRRAPRHLEIGFGMGDALLEMAQSHPENDYLGIEVHLPGVGRLLQRLGEMAITNVRIDRRDAVEVLAQLPAQSMARVYLFFPDPWSKKRQQKRRLVQALFIERLQQVLEPGGLFHATTDRDDYARHMITVIEATPGFINLAGPGHFFLRPAERPLTRYERRAVQQGHEVRDLIYKRL
jgi:tRNA (guanine-N7-)-methyltransferase